MPADLDYREDGSAVLAVAEGHAWHREGDVKVGARITPEEAEQMVPEWFATIEARPVYGQINGAVTELPDHVMHVRQGGVGRGGQPFPEAQVGLVGRHRYSLVQPRPAFDFTAAMMGQRSAAEVASIGTLRGGSVAFVSLYLGDAFLIPGEESERFARYLNTVNSYDGSYAFTATNSDVKIVCTNTLRWNMNTARKTKVRHTGDLDARLRAAREALGMAERYSAIQAASAEALADVPMSGAAIEELFANLTPLPLDKAGAVQEGRAATNARQLREVLHNLYATDPTVAHIRGTAWGALSTVTLYTNHHQTRKNTRTGTAADNRFEALVLDDSSPLETRAQKLLTPLIDTAAVLARAKDRAAEFAAA